MWDKIQQLNGRQLLATQMLVVSTLLWVFIPVIPFLPLATGQKVTAGVAALVLAEALGWAGMMMLGKETVAGLRQFWQKIRRLLSKNEQ